jgi:DNA repair protein RadA/Sms
LPRFVCEQCGTEAPKWAGKCSACGAWNSLVEQVASKLFRRPERRGPAPEAVAITEVLADREDRLLSGIEEFDRVLGGGLVPGSAALLAGEPGIGKSTLLLQVANALALNGGRVLYVTGEESLQQIRLRSLRLGGMSPQLLVLAETDTAAIEEQLLKLQPRLAVVDSIQTLFSPELDSPPGSVSQVREAAARVVQLAKELGLPIFLLGHVTKEGAIAGPRLLEHMVDTVLYLEGDRHSSYRLLRAVKNRFGATDELGLFEMQEDGLHGVPNPSEVLLQERGQPAPTGSAIVAVMEGTRPLLLEVQALASPSSPFGAPRRTISGADYGRVCLLLAVLEKAAGVEFSSQDVFVNIPGGVRVAEPGADLALALALASSRRDRPLRPEAVFVGEVGLTAEVRSVSHLGRRLSEAARLGFRRAIVPARAETGTHPGLEVSRVANLAEAFRAGFAAAPQAAP